MSDEINEWVLQTRGWRVFEEKDPAKWENSAFLDLEGRWFNVPWSNHFRFARAVLTDLKHLTEEEVQNLDLHAVSSELVEAGWLLIHQDITGLCILGADRMTMKQYRALKKHLGNKQLARDTHHGWTIEMLWKDMKERAMREDSKRL